MNLHGLLTTPPPSTAWLVDADMVAGIRRDRRGQLHVAAEPVPERMAVPGPVGLQTLDRETLSAALAVANERLEGARRVAMVVPTAWVRIHLLAFDELPRRAAEIREVVLWRLKKLLPVNPTELRVAPVVQPGEERRDVVCLSMLERSAAALEAACADVGLEVGYLGPRALALASAFAGGREPRLVVQQEPGFLSLVLVDRGAIRLVRTKPLASRPDAWETIERELGLMVDYLATELDLREGYTVDVVADDATLADTLRTWWMNRSEVSVAPPWRPDEAMPPGLGQRIGAARLAPGRSVVEGRAA
jgi:hypothetical protein